MQTVSLSQIIESLQKLPADKLVVVYDFVSYLVERETDQAQKKVGEALQCMLASEDVLRRDWDMPEEDEAWADL